VIGDAGQFTATDTVSIAASPSLAVSKAGGAALSFWIHANPGGAGSIIAIGDPAALRLRLKSARTVRSSSTCTASIFRPDR
jgi:hypothetical protein